MRFLLLFSCLFVSSLCYAEEFEVEQKNKMFSIEKITLKKGDVVHFKNADKIFHNVFSLSDTQFFDLGSYPQGESRAVTFETTGKVEVECAIHPQMYMVIDVKE